mgnify:CR=1 FL=1
MTNPNQQLLDYAVENIKEWYYGYTDLRADTSAKPLFFSVGDSWSKASGWAWSHTCPLCSYVEVEGTLVEFPPQVITKDEWLAEIKRRKEDKPMILKQDTEYNIMLTGIEIFDLYLITGSLHGNPQLYKKFQAMLGDSIYPHISTDVGLPTIKLTGAKGYLEAVAKAFKVHETEEERHLRELKEQYELLGDKIKQLSKY